jgi:sulfite reductase alpha subunit-like flavoprotein
MLTLVSSIDSVYLPWNQGLRAALLANYPLPESVPPIPEDVQLPPKVLLRLRSDGEEQRSMQDGQQDGERVSSADFPPPALLPIPGSRVARVSQNSRVTPEDHWQDVRELIFSVEPGGDRINVGPGSTLVIYPKNYPNDVQSLIDMMGWNKIADRPLARVSANGIYAREDATLRDLLTHNLDIAAVPKRTFLKELVYYASDDLEKERLVELTGLGNTDDFYDYTFRPRRTILEVLGDFPSVKIPFERAVDCFPAIRGREFSIANGARSQHTGGDSAGTKVHVLAALVEYRTIIRKPRQGLCSRYLRSLKEGTLIQVKIKHQANTLLEDDDLYKRPVIAVATGTGIAPIKHLMEDRYDRTTAASMGETVLFFGCRNEHADFHYRDVWTSLGGLEVIPAFSRDPAAVPPPVDDDQSLDYDRGKNYVQHQIRRHARRVADLIAKDALICVCGNSGRMPKSVREALLDAMVLGGLVKRKEDAEMVLQRLRFWQETW